MTMFGKSQRQIAEEAQAKKRREEADQPKVFSTTNLPLPCGSNSDREMIKRDRDAVEKNAANDFAAFDRAMEDAGWRQLHAAESDALASAGEGLAVCGKRLAQSKS